MWWCLSKVYIYLNLRPGKDQIIFFIMSRYGKPYKWKRVYFLFHRTASNITWAKIYAKLKPTWLSPVPAHNLLSPAFDRSSSVWPQNLAYMELELEHLLAGCLRQKYERIRQTDSRTQEKTERGERYIINVKTHQTDGNTETSRYQETENIWNFNNRLKLEWVCHQRTRSAGCWLILDCIRLYQLSSG